MDERKRDSTKNVIGKNLHKLEYHSTCNTPAWFNLCLIGFGILTLFVLFCVVCV